MELTPAHDVAQALAASLPDLTIGTNLYVGDTLRPVESNRSALMVAVGNEPGSETPFIDGGDRSRYTLNQVTIRIRGDKDQRLTAEMLANRILDLLNYGTVSGYHECRALASGVVSIGPNSDGFPEFIVSIVLRRTVQMFPLYRGVAATPGAYNEAFIVSLTPFYSSIRAHVFSVNAGATHRIWFCLPASMGTPVFYNTPTGMTALPFTLEATVDVTVGGEEVSYKVYGSVSAALGSVVCKVL